MMFCWFNSKSLHNLSEQCGQNLYLVTTIFDTNFPHLEHVACPFFCCWTLNTKGVNCFVPLEYTIGWSYGSWSYAVVSLSLYEISFDILSKLWSFQILQSTINKDFFYLFFLLGIVYHFIEAWFAIPFWAGQNTVVDVSTSVTDLFFKSHYFVV